MYHTLPPPLLERPDSESFGSSVLLLPTANAEGNGFTPVCVCVCVCVCVSE